MKCLDLNFTNWEREDFRRQSSREDWAKKLNISKKTLQRYEDNILYRDVGVLQKKSADRVLVALYWRDRRNKNRLDYYQKFILLVIKKLSFGEAYAYEKLSYEQIQEWFSETDQRTGRKRILSITPHLVKELLGI